MANTNHNSPRPLLPGEEPSDRSRCRNRKHAILIALLMLAAPQFALAQTARATRKPPRAVFGAITPCSSPSSSAAALPTSAATSSCMTRWLT